MSFQIPRDQVKGDTILLIDEFLFAMIVRSPSDQMNPDEVIIGFPLEYDSFFNYFVSYLIHIHSD